MSHPIRARGLDPCPPGEEVGAGVPLETRRRRQTEAALQKALRDQRRLEEELRASERREKEGRAKTEACASYQEMFLRILGHDLRNPLNTVLTTARLMKMRGELGGESERRLDRVVASGVRMERMIDQLLDITRARLVGGIAVDRSRAHELLPLVTRAVDAARRAHPDQPIELRSQGVAVANVDPERFEQVVANLLGNALEHGGGAGPVTVTLSAQGEAIGLSVHNLGKPIDLGRLPDLFDPFRAGAQAGSEGGLGLGLYLAERIVHAHGGKLLVESTADLGTRFEAILPAIAPPVAPYG